MRNPTIKNTDKGGGQSAPTGMVKIDDTKVRQLEKELALQRERLIKRRDAQDEAHFALATAQRAHDSTEARHLAGRTDDRALATARTALDAAKKRDATARLDCEETERLVAEVLPQAITEAKNAALAQLRDTLRSETQAKAKALAALLAQAKVLSDELRLLSDAADRHFSVTSMIRLQVSLVGCLDLGEEHGYVSPRAGVPDLACPYLTGQSVNQPTLYDHWRNELEAYLAKGTPEQMAAADRQNRISHIANDKRRYAEALVREAAQKKLEAMLEAQAGGRMPKGTQVLE